MPVINFQKRFAPMILSGDKTSTIRQHWKRPIKQDDWLHLYTGLRHVSRQKLGISKVEQLRLIEITHERILLENKLLSLDQTMAIVTIDGFDSFKSFYEFFDALYGLPFTGVLIKWGTLFPGPEKP